MKSQGTFILKASILYCIIAVSFSLIGIFLPEKAPQANPVGALSIQEVMGHILWGLVAGVVSLSLRYTLLGGTFALLIDSDHLIGLIHIDAISRMSHSIAFGIIAAIILMLIFGKRDFRLSAMAFGGMLAHISYDTFAGDDGKFPIFAPFYNHQIEFSYTDWIYFEIAAIVIVGIATILTKNQTKKAIV